jgi:hypothetical protein
MISVVTEVANCRNFPGKRFVAHNPEKFPLFRFEKLFLSPISHLSLSNFLFHQGSIFHCEAMRSKVNGARVRGKNHQHQKVNIP